MCLSLAGGMLFGESGLFVVISITSGYYVIVVILKIQNSLYCAKPYYYLYYLYCRIILTKIIRIIYIVLVVR